MSCAVCDGSGNMVTEVGPTGLFYATGIAVPSNATQPTLYCEVYRAEEDCDAGLDPIKDCWGVVPNYCFNCGAPL